ncbi:hypothetical protein P3T24_003796 [Paraburkholderia sp. GAS33]|uniref:hypothetical protein n=1 Tax=Paraburkholderia sp. GAS33 TaxID=3035130 RepID=UPI003D24BABE
MKRKLVVRSIDRRMAWTGSWVRSLHYALQTMIESLAHLSWLLSNIAVPILAPIALLPLLNFSLAYREIAGDVLKVALQHGQLFWTVIAMSAAACYELGCALDQPMFASSRSWIWIGLVWHTAFIVGSSVVVVFGAADARKYFSAADSAGAPGRLLLWSSVVATAIVATTFSISHYSLA